LRDLRRRRPGHQHFLKPGDVMETEVEGLGKMRNKFVAEAA
jgi:2-keto-4-pentenoate hydratase/2-oxohepta-3-ene-1,7-dioic acid hydratase in catechol pathway